MISIIIVNFNSGNFLHKCLWSIKTSIREHYEVIVVDNNSSDDSLDLCKDLFSIPNFICLRQMENFGFSKSNNIGAAHSKGDILHFLNPDTVVDSSLNMDYEKVIAHPDDIYVNALKNPDGSIMHSKHLLPTVPNFVKRIVSGNDAGYWYTGATLIISKENFMKIGGWNEAYFMYSEDLDLFYKAYKNKVIVKQLDSIILHIGGASSSKVWNNFQRAQRVESSIKKFYIINNIKWQYPFVVCLSLLRQLIFNPKQVMFTIKVLKSL